MFTYFSRFPHSYARNMARLSSKFPLVCNEEIVILIYHYIKVYLDHSHSVIFWRVTVVKDKQTRMSKGVAFVLFLDRETAHNCARSLNNKQVCCFNITLRLSKCLIKKAHMEPKCLFALSVVWENGEGQHRHWQWEGYRIHQKEKLHRQIQVLWMWGKFSHPLILLTCWLCCIYHR